MEACVGAFGSMLHCQGLCGREGGPYLLQVVKLHRNLPEEEVDVAVPLHRVHKVGLCRRGGVRTQPLT